MTHRDLKPENIMCIGEGKDLKIKLTDFGFACFFNPDKKMDISLGTPYYMAPELVEARTYDERVDVWSLGCIVYVLLSGKIPFSGNKIDDIADAILTKEVDFDPIHFADVSFQAKQFLSVCLTKNYE